MGYEHRLSQPLCWTMPEQRRKQAARIDLRYFGLNHEPFSAIITVDEGSGKTHTFRFKLLYYSLSILKLQTQKRQAFASNSDIRAIFFKGLEL